VAPCLTELVQGPTGICGRDVEALEGCSGFLPPAAGDVEPNYTSVEMPRVRPPLSSRSASGEQICTLDNTSILRPKIWAQFGHNLGTIWGAVMTNLERNLGAIWAPGARKLGVKPRKRATQFGQAGRATQFGQAGRARRPGPKKVSSGLGSEVECIVDWLDPRSRIKRGTKKSASCSATPSPSRRPRASRSAHRIISRIVSRRRQRGRASLAR